MGQTGGPASQVTWQQLQWWVGTEGRTAMKQIHMILRSDFKTSSNFSSRGFLSRRLLFSG